MPAEHSQKRRVRIGSLIAAVVVGLALLVFFMPDLFRKLEPSIEVVAVMERAPALEKASPVWVAGHEVGTVLSVQLRPAGVDSTERVAVRMSIPREFAAHVRSDSEVRVTSRRLIGEPVLDILPGSPTAPPIRSGDTLRVRSAGSIEGVLDRTFAVSDAFEKLFRDMESIERIPSEAREEQLRRLNRSFAAASAEFRDLLEILRSSPMNTLSQPEFRQALASLQARATELSNALRTTAERARRAQSEAQPHLRRLAARTDTIRAVLARVQANVAAGGGGLLLRAQRDSAISKALHEAQVQLDSLVAETRRNPLRFWF
ncbi:MAG: MlaD family protein [Gemmatimonadota bacterium]